MSITELIRPVDSAHVVCPQIQPADVAAIKGLGYRVIINNRPDHEEPGQPTHADIAAAAHAADMPYHFLPVVGSNITPQQVAQMDELLQSVPEPVFMFCRSGSRCQKLYQLVQQHRNAH